LHEFDKLRVEGSFVVESSLGGRDGKRCRFGWTFSEQHNALILQHGRKCWTSELESSEAKSMNGNKDLEIFMQHFIEAL
jgi:hypothetical protein